MLRNCYIIVVIWAFVTCLICTPLAFRSVDLGLLLYIIKDTMPCYNSYYVSLSILLCLHVYLVIPLCSYIYCFVYMSTPLCSHVYCCVYMSTVAFMINFTYPINEYSCIYRAVRYCKYQLVMVMKASMM